MCVGEIMNICGDAPQAAGSIIFVEDLGSVTSILASPTDTVTPLESSSIVL